MMFQFLNGPRTGKYVQLVTGLYRSCLSDGIPDIQGLYIIDVHSTHAYVIRRIKQTQLPSFGLKHK